MAAARPPLRAVVIGAGVGGSAAALLLAHAGIPVTLVEKNRRLGGSCAGYDKQGFHVDIGTHLFCRGPRGPLGEVLLRVGRAGAIQFRRTRDIAEIRLPRPRPGGHEELVRVAVPADLVRLPRFVWELARAVDLPAREALRAARLCGHILAMSDQEVRAWDGRSVEDFLAPYTDYPPLLALFGFLLGLYFVLPYWEVSAGEALWSFRRMVRDNWLSYPLGGSVAVPGTYCRLARELGAEIRTGVGVRRIQVRDGGVTGVELADGTVLPASIVVSTSSLRTTVFQLVGGEHFPAAYAERARRIRGSYIAVQAKIGLRRRLVEAGALVGGVGEGTDLLRLGTGDLKAMFRRLDAGQIPPIVPFYCPVPTNFDPQLAPPGCQLLTVCAVAPTSDVALADSSAAWEEAMLRALARVVPGLHEHTLFVDRFSVRFIERWIGKQFGPAVSTAQTPDQVGAGRPPVYTPLGGLYLAGCGAGGRGVGTELACASALECTDRILADLGRELPARPGASPLERAGGLMVRAALAPLAWATRARLGNVSIVHS
jgi:prolycopene isomerase